MIDMYIHIYRGMGQDKMTIWVDKKQTLSVGTHNSGGGGGTGSKPRIANYTWYRTAYLLLLPLASAFSLPCLGGEVGIFSSGLLILLLLSCNSLHISPSLSPTFLAFCGRFLKGETSIGLFYYLLFFFFFFSPFPRYCQVLIFPCPYAAAKPQIACNGRGQQKTAKHRNVLWVRWKHAGRETRRTLNRKQPAS